MQSGFFRNLGTLRCIFSNLLNRRRHLINGCNGIRYLYCLHFACFSEILGRRPDLLGSSTHLEGDILNLPNHLADLLRHIIERIGNGTGKILGHFSPIGQVPFGKFADLSQKLHHRSLHCIALITALDQGKRIVQHGVEGKGHGTHLILGGHRRTRLKIADTDLPEKIRNMIHLGREASGKQKRHEQHQKRHNKNRAETENGHLSHGPVHFRVGNIGNHRPPDAFGVGFIRLHDRKRGPGAQNLAPPVILNDLGAFLTVQCASGGLCVNFCIGIQNRGLNAQFFQEAGVVAPQLVRADEIGLPGFAQAGAVLHDGVDLIQGQFRGHDKLHLTLSDHRLGKKGRGCVVTGGIFLKVGHSEGFVFQNSCHQPAQVGILMGPGQHVGLIVLSLLNAVKKVSVRVDQAKIIVAVSFFVLRKKVLLFAFPLGNKGLGHIHLGQHGPGHTVNRHGHPGRQRIFAAVVNDNPLTASAGQCFGHSHGVHHKRGIHDGAFSDMDRIGPEEPVRADQICPAGFAHAGTILHDGVDLIHRNLYHDDTDGLVARFYRCGNKCRWHSSGRLIFSEILKSEAFQSFLKSLSRGAVFELIRCQILSQVRLLGHCINDFTAGRDKKRIIITVIFSEVHEKRGVNPLHSLPFRSADGSAGPFKSSHGLKHDRKIGENIHIAEPLCKIILNKLFLELLYGDQLVKRLGSQCFHCLDQHIHVITPVLKITFDIGGFDVFHRFQVTKRLFFQNI